MTVLLPPNATRLERALSLVIAEALAVPVPVARMWRPDQIPAAFLPWLAWGFSVDDWDAAWPEARQRAVIAAAVEVHRRKGTIGAVRRALAVAGWGTARIIERWGVRVYDGTVARTGATRRTRPDHWAEYRVVLDRPITIAQARAVRRLLQSVAPARCHLNALTYPEALHLYNRTVPRTGTYARGTA